MRFFSILFSVMLLSSINRFSSANNLNISAPVVNGANLDFTISWDNSWFTTLGSANWDAVWVFVKRQNCTNNLWVHAPLSTSNVHTATGGLVQVDPVTDGMGVFIRRFAVGAGAVPSATISLTLQTAANATDNFQIHGIEMVSVPTGDFIIGGGGTCTFNSVTITAAIQAAGITQAAYGSACGSGFGNLPAAFPLGYNNFYAMKYEISQEQYGAFLNTLTYTQQAARMVANPNAAIGTSILGANRNGLEISTPGVVSNVPAIIGSDLNNNNIYNENGDGQNIACNFLSWADLAAYLDWSALRPMTEFEYEKLCRGTEPQNPGGEYAWGSLSLLQASSGALTNAGTNSEVSTAFGNGLCAINVGGGGPLRCGFAAGLTTRQQAGSGFYGNMDLSGNVWEQCIGGSNSNMATFTTANGDGLLSNPGFANVPTWPAIGGGNAGGAIIRGGGFDAATARAIMSDRNERNNNANQGRVNSIGGRGVRNF